MSAFLLVLVAVASRLMPHPDWLNFTAVGGSLLYFGARRPLRQAFIPVILLAATDYYLTTIAYSYPFRPQEYLLTWAWYFAVILMGSMLLKTSASAGRLLGAAALSATSFFAVSNFAVWSVSRIYPHSIAGLSTCYIAGLFFYRNDLISTAIVVSMAFALPKLVRSFAEKYRHGPVNPA